MDNSFFALAFRMKYIHRWGLMYSVQQETLSTHSMEVALCAHALAVIGNERFGKSYDADRIAVKGLYHDVPEIFTGDIPTPVKYYSKETHESYSAVEDAALSKMISLLPDELRNTYVDLFSYTPDEKKLVKAADKLCALIKCRTELHFGNSEYRDAEQTLLKSFHAAECEEAEYFLETFGDSFTQPIDTLIESK